MYRASVSDPQEFEIYGQRLNAATGEKVGTEDFRISQMGPDTDQSYEARNPRVVYNSIKNQYLVAWTGDTNDGDLVDGEYEIFGQLIDGATGAEVGTDDFRISDAGGDGNPNYDAAGVALAFNSHDNEYLATWYADENYGGLVNDEAEIFGQRLDGNGQEIGANDFRISSMGPDGNTNFGTGLPSVAYSSARNNFFVIWAGDDNTAPLVDNEGEMFGGIVNFNNTALPSNFCSEWNGYVDLWNVAEFVNASSSDIALDATMFDNAGVSQSTNGFQVSANAQTDLLVHDLGGFQSNQTGALCSAITTGSTEDVDGRIVHYRPTSSGFDFAYALPFSRGLVGNSYVSFNTYQPSLDPADGSNFVANWVSIFNNDQESAQSGTVKYYTQAGSLISSQSVSIDANAHIYLPVHEVGAQQVGLVEWIPNSGSDSFQLRNIRYFYDNSTLSVSFDGAVPIEGQKGSFQPLYAPVDTRDGTSVIEISNPTSSALQVGVVVYNTAGTSLSSSTYNLAAHATTHVIIDSILNAALGSVRITPASGGQVLATVLQYGRTASGGLSFLYNVPAEQPVGATVRGSYNTFLNQGCKLAVVNSSAASQDLTISITRYDGTSVVSGQSLTVEAGGTNELDVCALETATAFGVVSVVPETNNTIYATVIREGENDSYRFSTAVR